MHAQELATALDRALVAAKLRYRAKLSPADDDSVDDEVELTLIGASTSFAVQVGYGYAALNELEHDTSGDVSGVKIVRHWDLPKTATVVRDVLQFVSRRV